MARRGSLSSTEERTTWWTCPTLTVKVSLIILMSWSHSWNACMKLYTLFMNRSIHLWHVFRMSDSELVEHRVDWCRGQPHAAQSTYSKKVDIRRTCAWHTVCQMNLKWRPKSRVHFLSQSPVLTETSRALGILYGTMTLELGGQITIACEKTGYSAQLEFKLKVWLRFLV